MAVDVRTHEILAERVERTDNPDDQLYLLKLCLELQLEALLLALGSSAVADPSPLGEHAPEQDDLPWPRWLAEDIELARALTRECVDDGVPLPSAMGGVPTDPGAGTESLTVRYSAMAAVVHEMLGQIDPIRRPGVVRRLVQTRDRCERRLAELLGRPMSAALEAGIRDRDAGHYLG